MSSASDPADGAGAEPQEARAFSWNAFLSTYLPALVLALGAGMALPAIPALAKSFHVSFGLASLVITSFLIGNVAGTIPTGWLVDRFGRRRIMLIGPVLTSAMAFLVLTAHSFPELLVYRFVDGWAAQMWLIGRLAGISHGAAANQRGRQISWMFGMDSVGRLSGPLAGGFIAASFGIRAPFAGYGLFALLALIPAFMYIQDTPTRRQRTGGEPGLVRKITLRQIIMPRLSYFGVAFFAAMARGTTSGGLMYLYAAYAYGLNARSIGFLATTASCVSLPIGFFSGWSMDRFGRKRTMVPGFFGVTFSMILLGVTAFLHLPFFWYLVVFLPGVAVQALTGGSIQTVGADVAPPEARGLFLGLYRFTGQGGTALSPLVFAFLADRSGYGSSFLFIASAALCVALLLVFAIPETSVREPSEKESTSSLLPDQPARSAEPATAEPQAGPAVDPAGSS